MWFAPLHLRNNHEKHQTLLHQAFTNHSDISGAKNIYCLSCVTWIQTTRSIQRMNKNMSIHSYIRVKNANGFESFGEFGWKTVVCIQCGYSVVDVLVYPVSNSDFSGVKTQILGLNDACNECVYVVGKFGSWVKFHLASWNGWTCVMCMCWHPSATLYKHSINRWIHIYVL